MDHCDNCQRLESLSPCRLFSLFSFWYTHNNDARVSAWLRSKATNLPWTKLTLFLCSIKIMARLFFFLLRQPAKLNAKTSTNPFPPLLFNAWLSKFSNYLNGSSKDAILMPNSDFNCSRLIVSKIQCLPNSVIFPLGAAFFEQTLISAFSPSPVDVRDTHATD